MRAIRKCSFHARDMMSPLPLGIQNNFVIFWKDFSFKSKLIMLEMVCLVINWVEHGIIIVVNTGKIS